jgi:plastocyanin
VTIRVNQTVRWVNLDSTSHEVTSGQPGDADAGALFDSGSMSPGITFVHTFYEAGVFTCYCSLHDDMPSMVGATVTVTE